MRDKVTIGIDPSYARTGVSFIVGGNVVIYGSFERGKLDRVNYRASLKEYILEQLDEVATIHSIKQEPLVHVYIERNNTSVRGAIMASSELIASLEDMFFSMGVDVFEQTSASTWQSFIGRKMKDVEKYKDERKPAKMPVIRYVEDNLGICCAERLPNGDIKVDKQGKVWYNDDMADAICLGLYGDAN